MTFWLKLGVGGVELGLEAGGAFDDVFPIFVGRVDGQGQRHEHQAHHDDQHDEDLAQQIHVRFP